MVSEVFSGLFSPAVSSGARSLGYGGMAVIDVQSGHSLHISIWFNASIDVSKGMGRFLQRIVNAKSFEIILIILKQITKGTVIFHSNPYYRVSQK